MDMVVLQSRGRYAREARQVWFLQNSLLGLGLSEGLAGKDNATDRTALRTGHTGNATDDATDSTTDKRTALRTSVSRDSTLRTWTYLGR